MNNISCQATQANQVWQTSAELSLNFNQLKFLFDQLPDPGLGQSNLQYSFPAMLLAALMVLLCNHLDELAIAQWLADLRRLLALKRGNCCTNLRSGDTINL